ATATLTLRAAPAAGTAGQSLTGTARRLSGNVLDIVAANDSASVTVVVLPPQMRIVTGTYVGDGTAARAITGLGFQPDVVLVKGATTGTILRLKGMPADVSKELGVA